MSESHAARRDPSTPEGPLDLAAEGDDLLAQAQEMSSGRAARTLNPSAHGVLKQTLVALRNGVRLSEHEANGPATIQLLRGSATIDSGAGSIHLDAGEWSAIPDVRHDLQAHADTLALITVAPTSR